MSTINVKPSSPQQPELAPEPSPAVDSPGEQGASGGLILVCGVFVVGCVLTVLKLIGLWD